MTIELMFGVVVIGIVIGQLVIAANIIYLGWIFGRCANDEIEFGRGFAGSMLITFSGAGLAMILLLLMF